MTTTGRRGRLFRRPEELLDADEGADLSEDQHAWWAAREEVAGIPRGMNAEPEATEAAPESAFSDYWSTESLFDKQPKAPPPPPAAEQAADLDVPGGMDLDSAHLVLQVRIGVTWEEITAAHRTLAKRYHPDRLMDYSVEAQALGRARMSEINSAHATLKALHFHS